MRQICLGLGVHEDVDVVGQVPFVRGYVSEWRGEKWIRLTIEPVWPSRGPPAVIRDGRWSCRRRYGAGFKGVGVVIDHD